MARKLKHVKLYNFLDGIFSPPPNYSNFTYYDRLRLVTKNFLEFKQPHRNIFHIAKLSCMIGASKLFFPFIYILKKSGFRFVDIDLNQIGSIFFLDLLLRDDALYHNTPKYKIFALASETKDANRYLCDLYNRYITFVRNPFLKFLLSPFFVSKVFVNDSHYRYDTIHFTETVAHKIWNDYLEKYRKPLIEFPPSDIEKAKILLKPYIGNKKFIALHARDSGFYKDEIRTTRNSDINTYQKAIELLISMGYAIVRLGDPTADSIDRMIQECGPDLFDYAHSNIKSEMMDCYLISQCEFFIGGPSGPSSIPMLFGVSSCNMNWNNITNAPNFLQGDVTAFKKIRYKTDNSFVPFKTLLKPPFIFSPNLKSLEAEGLYLENNTDDEILETLKEFLQGPNVPLSVMQEKAQSLYTEENYALNAKGKLPNAILKYYF